MRCRGAAVGAVVCAAGAGLFGGVAVAAATGYTLVGAFTAPGGTWDVLPDGRLISIDADQVVVQDGVNASSYSLVGSVAPGLINGNASFVRTNPSGTMIAFGDNNFGVASNPRVYLLQTSTLDAVTPSPVTPVAAANFDAAWADDTTLFVSGGDAFGADSYVTRIDASNLGAVTADLAIGNVDGSSGGVAIDGGYLYTANGYDNGPGGSSTGTIRAFPLGSLVGGGVAFGSGVEIGDVLSGSPLDFDPAGNLLVGGGDFDSGDFGYAGAVGADAVASALGGGAPASGIDVQQLAPGGPFDFYSIRANRATGEVLVTYFGNDTVYRYALPSPGAVVAIGLAGVVGVGRRRRA